jgi:hypothetical protein
MTGVESSEYCSSKVLEIDLVFLPKVLIYKGFFCLVLVYSCLYEVDGFIVASLINVDSVSPSLDSCLPVLLPGSRGYICHIDRIIRELGSKITLLEGFRQGTDYAMDLGVFARRQ